MLASRIVVCFVFFSLVGWVFESAYCSITEKRWCNRGFLFGPVCPIYGVGAVAAIAVFGNAAVQRSIPPAWVVFLVCAAGTSAIEWVTSVAMERLFGAVWWDYSNMPLNLKGRVCVPAAALFGLAGCAITYLVVPALSRINGQLDPLAVEVASLVLTALVAADATLTVCTLTEVLAAVEQLEAEFDSRMQAAVEAVPEIVPDISAGLQSRANALREDGERRMDRVREGGAEHAERIRELAGRMGARQSHILHNARRFSSRRTGAEGRRGAGEIGALTQKSRR